MTTVQCKRNFYMHGKPKEFIWLTLLQYLLYCGGLEPNSWYLQGGPVTPIFTNTFYETLKNIQHLSSLPALLEVSLLVLCISRFWKLPHTFPVHLHLLIPHRSFPDQQPCGLISSCLSSFQAPVHILHFNSITFFFFLKQITLRPF